MANDSIEIIDPLEFHPCDTPRGCLYYNTNVLTDDQQNKLNVFKNNVMRKNSRYLRRHPEVRAFIFLILRYVLSKRPRKNVHLVIGQFFARSRNAIQEEVREYVTSRNLEYQGEESEEEEEVSEEYQFADYDMAKGEEEEEEEMAAEAEEEGEVHKTPSVSTMTTLTEVFRAKSSQEREFITELLLQQFGQFSGSSRRIPVDEEYVDDFTLFEVREEEDKVREEESKMREDEEKVREEEDKTHTESGTSTNFTDYLG